MSRFLIGLAACAALAAASPAPAASAAKPSRAHLRNEVLQAERAFAHTMAARDHAGFARYLAREAVFFGGPEPLRGRAAIAAGWKRFFDTPAAPFSWEPDQVEVLDSGTLALSSGPVRDAHGTLIATFTSIWRREAPGVWRVIFDKGCDVCTAAKDGE